MQELILFMAIITCLSILAILGYTILSKMPETSFNKFLYDIYIVHTRPFSKIVNYYTIPELIKIDNYMCLKGSSYKTMFGLVEFKHYTSDYYCLTINGSFVSVDMPNTIKGYVKLLITSNGSWLIIKPIS